jgi:hypothetical protein
MDLLGESFEEFNSDNSHNSRAQSLFNQKMTALLNLYRNLIHDNAPSDTVHQAYLTLDTIVKKILPHFHTELEQTDSINWEERFGILGIYKDRLKNLLLQSGAVREAQTHSPNPSVRAISDSLIEKKYQQEARRVLLGYDDIIKNTLGMGRMDAIRERKDLALSLKADGHLPIKQRVNILEHYSKKLESR